MNIVNPPAHVSARDSVNKTVEANGNQAPIRWFVMGAGRESTENT